jgi:hypothetical protein
LSQGLVQGFSQRVIFCSNVSDFFLLCHGLSVSERSHVNNILWHGITARVWVIFSRAVMCARDGWQKDERMWPFVGKREQEQEWSGIGEAGYEPGANAPRVQSANVDARDGAPDDACAERCQSTSWLLPTDHGTRWFATSARDGQESVPTACRDR